jgi:hypothetical protein
VTFTCRGVLVSCTFSPDGGEVIPLASVEVYDLALAEWREVAPLPTTRSSLAIATGSDGESMLLEEVRLRRAQPM